MAQTKMRETYLDDNTVAVALVLDVVAVLRVQVEMTVHQHAVR